jgi:hypothetical protein
MAKPVKPEKILESLKKLYEKRKVLDQQILEAEKSFVATASVLPGVPVTKNAGCPKRKAPASRKPSVKQ